MNALARARITLIGAALLVAVVLAGRIFDASQFSLVVPAVVVTGTALAVVRARWLIRFAAWSAATVVAVLIVSVLEGGGIATVWRSLLDGTGQLLSTEWPSPEQPALVATVAWYIAVFGGLAADLAGRRRLHLLPLVPILALVTLLIALAAPAGPALVPMFPLALVAAAFATLRPGSSWTRRLSTLSGERRLLPILLAALTVTGVLGAAVTLSDRADPRDPPTEGTPLVLIDPVEAVRALRTLPTEQEMFDVEVEPGAPVSRWRTGALDRYDGQRWAPDLTLRPIGNRLDPDSDGDITATITYADDRLRLVPLPGSPVHVDRDVLTDASRSMLVLADRPQIGDTVTIRADAPTSAAALDALPAQREVAVEDSALEQTAYELADGDSEDPALQLLRNIEQVMRDDFVLVRTVEGDGLQRALLARFLRERRGTEEQFAATFVLLARAIGVDARLAAGFEVEQPAASMTITSEDAAVWPEVRFDVGDDTTWVAFDPFPEEPDESPSDPEPETQQVAAGAPQLPPPQNESDRDEPAPEQQVESAQRSTLMRVLGATLRVAGAIGLLLLPLLVAAGAILVLKRQRRRRLLATDHPLERIRAEWVVTTDELIDAGLEIRRAETDTEVARTATSSAPAAADELVRLATLAQQATFGQPARADVLVLDAQQCRAAISASIAAERSWVRRVMWRLSLRSLRTRTRSPIRSAG